MTGEPEGSQRRLAAILSMEAVGYGRLMAADELATVRMLTAYRDEIARLVAGPAGAWSTTRATTCSASSRR